MKADERRTRAGKRLSVQRWMNLPGAHTKPQSRSRGNKKREAAETWAIQIIMIMMKKCEMAGRDRASNRLTEK